MIATFLTTSCRELGLRLGADSFSRHFSRQSVVSGGTSELSNRTRIRTLCPDQTKN
jgi:hypothetical protein